MIGVVDMGMLQTILDSQLLYNKFMPKFAKRYLATISFNRVDDKLQAEFGRHVSNAHAQLPKIQGEAPRFSCGPVLFAVADLVYFRKFGNIFLSSIAKKSPESTVHLHVIGATKKQVNVAQKLLQLIPKNFALTFEQIELDVFDQTELSQYCQCMRFVRLEQFVKETRLDYMAFDIDSIIRQPFSTLNIDILQNSVGLICRNEFDPTRKIAAGVVYVRPDDKAKKFLKYATDRMLLHIKFGTFSPMLDQRCLAMAMKRYPDVVFPFSSQFYSFEPGRGLVYSAKGRQKNDLLEKTFADEILSA